MEVSKCFSGGEVLGLETGIVMWKGYRGENIPSTIDNPERSMGTREIVSGIIVVVVYS